METLESLTALPRAELVAKGVSLGVKGASKLGTPQLAKAILNLQDAGNGGQGTGNGCGADAERIPALGDSLKAGNAGEQPPADRSGDGPGNSPNDGGAVGASASPSAQSGGQGPAATRDEGRGALYGMFDSVKRFFSLFKERTQDDPDEPVDVDAVVDRWQWVTHELRRSPATAWDKEGWWKIEVANDGSAVLTQFAQVPYFARRPEHRHNTFDVTLKLNSVPEFLVLLTAAFTQSAEIIAADEMAMQDEEEALERRRAASALEVPEEGEDPDPSGTKLAEMQEHFGMQEIEGDALLGRLARALGVPLTLGEAKAAELHAPEGTPVEEDPTPLLERVITAYDEYRAGVPA